VVATPREVFDQVGPGVRVRYRRSEPPPPYTYAVTVEVEVAEESWIAVRLWDNADDVNEHHMHRYTQREGKQSPEILSFNSVNEAMAAAKKEAREEWAEIVRQWLQS
jgi:hypothetical protein